MSWDDSANGQTELIEVCWRIRGRSGQLFKCAIVKTETGLAVRVSEGADGRVSTTPVKDLEEGRARAATLRRILLEDGEFEELAGD